MRISKNNEEQNSFPVSPAHWWGGGVSYMRTSLKTPKGIHLRPPNNIE